MTDGRERKAVAADPAAGAGEGNGWQRPESGYAAVRVMEQVLTYSVIALIIAGSLFFSQAHDAALVPAAGLPLLALVVALFHTRALMRRMGYRLTEDGIQFRTGVLWQRELMIPFSRIQHLARRQGPVERLWGLSSLLIYTAGASSADCTIPGLSAAGAEALEHTILQHMRNRDRDGDGHHQP